MRVQGLRPGPGSTAPLTQRLCDPALNPNLKPHVEVDEEDADRELAKLMRAAKIQFQDLDEVTPGTTGTLTLTLTLTLIEHRP